MSMLNLFCYVLGDKPNSVFPVEIDSSETISDLKRVIKAEKSPTFNDVAADMLRLWKVSIAADEILGIDANNYKDGSSLSPMSELSELFPDHPAKNLVHIVVKSPLANAAKRARSPSAEPSTAKRARTENEDLKSKDRYKELFHKLQNIDHDEPQLYSDPSKLMDLPFPCISAHPPSERFALVDEISFKYMGRKKFLEVWHEIIKLRNYGGYVEVYIHGTMRYGKSHNLAAIVCLLFRTGRRVVYIPDCRQMLKHPLTFFKGALLLAFADVPNYRTQIQGLASLDEVEKICSNEELPNLYFVLDQMNVFDEAPSNTDKLTNSERHDVNKFMSRAAWRHYLITSSLANYKTIQHMKKSQTHDRKLSMMGGFDDEEMLCWWRHHQDQLPKLDGDYKARLEDITGRVPLLLRSLLNYGGKDFEAVEGEFLNSPDLLQVQDNIQDFALKQNSRPLHDYNRYLDVLYCCIVEKIPAKRMDSDFDFRYFFYEDTTKKCRYTCGWARKAASLLLWQRSKVPFRLDDLFNAFEIHKNNPSALGFLVEQACLSAMIDTGLKFGGESFRTVAFQVFEGDLLKVIPSGLPNDFQRLYIPSNPRYEDIDALYFRYVAKEKKVFVVPIQIMIEKHHKDSEYRFYLGWLKWVDRFKGYHLETTFVWIRETEPSSKLVEEEIRKARQGSIMINPKHIQVKLTLKNVYPEIAAALARSQQTYSIVELNEVEE